MCKWGTDEEVEVTMQPFDPDCLYCKNHPWARRCLGEWKKKCKIDKCIAPLVRALERGGIRMVASCCGHGKDDGCIDLLDGRILVIKDGEKNEKD